MGILFAFAVGYVVGARAGSKDFDDVVEAMQAIGRSEEFRDLLAALRSHAAHTLRELATVLDRPGDQDVDQAPASTQDLVERVKSLMGGV
jgi:hypothetical protein